MMFSHYLCVDLFISSRLDKEKMTFTASGREDTDVRCLGSGRPFYVKIDCIKKIFPEEMFRKLEQIVNKSPDVSIFDMQATDKYEKILYIFFINI